MPDLSAATRVRYPDAEILLAALLHTLGDPPLIPYDTLEGYIVNRHDPAIEITAEDLPEGLVIRLRRRETLLDRTQRFLTQQFVEDVDAGREAARELLQALGADPDRIAP